MVSNHRIDGLRYGTQSLQTLGLNSLWVRRFSTITHRIDGYSNLSTTWYRGSAPNHLAWTPLIDKTLTTISSGVNQEIMIGDSTLGWIARTIFWLNIPLSKITSLNAEPKFQANTLDGTFAWIPDKIWLGRTSVALGDKLQVATLVHAQSSPTNWYEKMYAPIDTFVYTRL